MAKEKQRYSLANRLSDVIRLIYVLSQGDHAFRSEDAINSSLRGKPLSANTWEDVVISHPEFFRPTGSGKYFGLLIRTYFVADENEKRPTLSVDQTQKQIDVAISLHDKEIARIQKNSHKIPLLVSAIALFGVIISPIITSILNQNNMNKMDSINNGVKNIETKLVQYIENHHGDSTSFKNQIK